MKNIQVGGENCDSMAVLCFVFVNIVYTISIGIGCLSWLVGSFSFDHRMMLGAFIYFQASRGQSHG